MFFAFQTLMLTILSITLVNSLIIKDKPKSKDQFNTKITRKSWEIRDDEPKNETSFTTRLPLFKIMKNPPNTKSQNLKSNVFDKMLSDEMLSMKQHFYEQDIKTSTVAMASVSNALTPTLEVKQRWPIAEFDSTTNKYERGEETDPQISYAQENMNDQEINNQQKESDEKSNTKILELRSLPNVKLRSVQPLFLKHGDNMCNCMKKNIPMSSVCSSRTTCTDMKNTQKCTHKECTRMSIYSTVYYVTYQPFFLGITQSPNKFYYHPEVVNEMKWQTKKKKHRKTTKAGFDDSLYYDNGRHTEDYGDELLYDDKYGLKPKVYNDEVGQIILNVADDDNHESKYIGPQIQKLKLPKKYDEDRKGARKDKMLNDLVSDLQNRYSDSVIKDCYCPLMVSRAVSDLNCFYNVALCLLVIILYY